MPLNPLCAAEKAPSFRGRDNYYAHFTDGGLSCSSETSNALPRVTQLSTVEWNSNKHLTLVLGSFGTPDICPGCALGTHVIDEAGVAPRFPQVGGRPRI